jgi:hypothetical protein
VIRDLCGRRMFRKTRRQHAYYACQYTQLTVRADAQADHGLSADQGRLRTQISDIERPKKNLIRKRPRQDSNLRTRLRRAVLYPLSYGGSRTGKEYQYPGATMDRRGHSLATPWACCRGNQSGHASLTPWRRLWDAFSWWTTMR